MNKKDLYESDIKAKFITPALTKAAWDEQIQLGREIFFTDGRINLKGRMTARGKRKFADYILFYKPNVPIALIEAKDYKHSVRGGIQQALGYANEFEYTKRTASRHLGKMLELRLVNTNGESTKSPYLRYIANE